MRFPWGSATKLLVPVLLLALAAVAVPGGVVANVGTGETRSFHRSLKCGDVYAADGFSPRTVPASSSWGQPEIGSDPWEVTFGGSDLDLWSVENGIAKARTTPVTSSGQRVPAARDVEMQTRFSVNALPKRSSISTGFFARFRRIGGPTGDHVRMRVRIKAGRLLITIAAMAQADVGIRTTHTAGPMRPTISYDDFRVSAPSCPVGSGDLR